MKSTEGRREMLQLVDSVLGVPSLSPQPKEKEESAEYFRILKLSLGTEVGNEEKTVCGQRNEPSSLKKLDFMQKPIE